MKIYDRIPGNRKIALTGIKKSDLNDITVVTGEDGYKT